MLVTEQNLYLTQDPSIHSLCFHQNLPWHLKCSAMGLVLSNRACQSKCNNTCQSAPRFLRHAYAIFMKLVTSADCWGKSVFGSGILFVFSPKPSFPPQCFTQLLFVRIMLNSKFKTFPSKFTICQQKYYLGKISKSKNEEKSDFVISLPDYF